VRLPRICSRSGCPEIATSYTRYCINHPPPRSPSSQATGSSSYKRARLAALKRDSWTCQICFLPGADQADHIIPVADGGSHELSNLRAAHGRCNNLRGDGSRDHLGD
jgi:5-methylcytosine-specific restriction endonuclease McrA